jgi:phosphate transport system permease protein
MSSRNPRRREKIFEKSFIGLCLLAVILPLLLLLTLLIDVGIDSADRLNWSFLSSYPSRKPELAGILPGLVGSIYLILLTAAMALPIGVGAAVYLEEYGKKGRLANFIETNISNLAGVPSIIYGLLGLEVFVRTVGLGRSLFAGACTMALLILPIVIMASREALRTVPLHLREGAFALGATHWQCIRQVVLPQAFPGILTGAILAVSRAIGEAAPLIVVGALAYIAFLPDSVSSPFTVLPIQIFNWVSRPQEAFLLNAAAGSVVLLITLLLLNGLAIYLRGRLQKRRSM